MITTDAIIKNWIRSLDSSSHLNISKVLDSAPEEIQKLRGAWENKDFSLLLRAASAISFVERFFAATNFKMGYTPNQQTKDPEKVFKKG